MVSRNAIALDKVAVFQEGNPNWDICEVNTKASHVLCLLVVSQGNALKCYLNDEMHDNEQNPGPDKGASHYVLILCGLVVRLKSRV